MGSTFPALPPVSGYFPPLPHRQVDSLPPAQIRVFPRSSTYGLSMPSDGVQFRAMNCLLQGIDTISRWCMLRNPLYLLH